MFLRSLKMPRLQLRNRAFGFLPRLAGQGAVGQVQIDRGRVAAQHDIDQGRFGFGQQQFLVRAEIAHRTDLDVVGSIRNVGEHSP